MAEAIVEILLNNVESLIKREFSVLWNAKSDLEKLSSTLKTIQAVLADAETQQINKKAIEDWLEKLKDAAYDADDILDEWATDESLFQHPSNNHNKVHAPFSSLKNKAKLTKSRYKIAKKIKKIRERFDEIAKEKSDFHLSNQEPVNGGPARPSENRNRETSSVLNELQIYGRDADKENIIKSLLDGDADADVSVFPILGIGGLGKTTLAQLVYNDERVVKHFESRIWYCVSDDFDVKKMSKAIVKSVSGCGCDPDDTLDHVQVRLRKTLEGRRFLLVLDDVWSEKQDEWTKFKNSLTSGAKGSSVILTTRLPTVAKIAGTAAAYKLSLLSKDDCLMLFLFYAFGNVGHQENPNLVEIGRQIIEKCRGVPLAARALGSLLRFTQDERQWERIRDSEIWNLQDGKEETILPALRLSYNYLSSHARQCFAYCSLFPKDYEMEKENLIYIWMANGLIPIHERTDLEVAGDEIFNELLWHSMLEESTYGFDGNIEGCRMHDLLHDLASSILKKDCLHIIKHGGERDVIIPSKVRHLSVSSSSSKLRINHPNSQLSLRTLMFTEGCLDDFTRLTCLRMLHLEHADLSTVSPSIGDLKHLRYLSLVYCRRLQSLPEYFFCKLRNLQMLNLDWNDLVALPYSIGDLKNLRYLNVSKSEITSLPESIGGLRRLQTLIVSECKSLKALPEAIRSLHGLKHLDTRQCWRLEGMPNGIGSLTGLQTLSWFEVGDEERGFGGIRELEGLNLLSGSLGIGGLHHVKSLEDAKGASLMSKPNLSRLSLCWDRSDLYEEDVKSRSREVLEGLQPHPNIKQLIISYYPGAEFPTWMQMGDPRSSFPRLVKLVLSSLHFLEEWSLNWKLNESLPALQFLQLSDCSLLKSLPVQICNLTSLKSLHISSCFNLASLPHQFSRLTSLESLEIWDCPSLRSLPELGMQGQKSSLKNLEVNNYTRLTSRLEGLQHLTALESLTLRNCPKLTFSAKDLEHLTALKSLELDPPVDLPESVKARVRLTLYDPRNQYEGN